MTGVLQVISPDSEAAFSAKPDYLTTDDLRPSEA